MLVGEGALALGTLERTNMEVMSLDVLLEVVASAETAAAAFIRTLADAHYKAAMEAINQVGTINVFRGETGL